MILLNCCSLLFYIWRNIVLPSIDYLLDRQQGPEYNCLDFVREAWLHLTDGRHDITKKLTRLTGAFSGRKTTVSGVKSFRKLSGPKSPCLVVMQRFKFIPHIGLYLDGRILHLTDRGVQFQPLIVARQYFLEIKYYE